MEEPETKFQLESPGGRILVQADCKNSKVVKVTLQSMPAFVAYRDKMVEVEGLEAPVRVDCAFGGMWYAIVDADQLGLKIEPSQGGKIAKLGEKIKVATRDQFPVFHPDNPGYVGPDILAFTSQQKEITEGAEAVVYGLNTVVMSSGSTSDSAILDRDHYCKTFAETYALIIVDPEDPLQGGYTVADIWSS